MALRAELGDFGVGVWADPGSVELDKPPIKSASDSSSVSNVTFVACFSELFSLNNDCRMGTSKRKHAIL